ISCVGALGSAATCLGLALAGFDTSRLYYGTDTRAQALLVGAALACIGAGRHQPGLHVRGREQRMLAKRLAIGGAGFAGAAGWCGAGCGWTASPRLSTAAVSSASRWRRLPSSPR